MYADTAFAPDFDDGIGHFQQQPRPVCDGAAIAICPLVSLVLKKLVKKVAIGAMDFDAIKSCPFGILCRFDIISNDDREFPPVRGRGVSHSLAWGVTGRHAPPGGWRWVRREARHRGRSGRRCDRHARAGRGSFRPWHELPLVTSFQPSTCASDHRPGVSG